MNIRSAGLILVIFCVACGDSGPTPVVLSIDASLGGGITGAYGGVSLDANYQVSTFSGGPNLPSVTTPIKTIDAGTAKRILSKAIELRSYNYGDLGTGDMFYSITIHMANEDHYITWSPGSARIDPRVVDLYKDLGHLVE